MKSSTKRIDNKKDFDTEINFITKIDAVENFELKLSTNTAFRALLNRGELNFKLEINNILQRIVVFKIFHFPLIIKPS